MEEVRYGVVVPLRSRQVRRTPRPMVRRLKPRFSGEAEVLELYGERQPRERPVTELRDRVPPHRLF
jgi:hypothetical protein